MTSTGRLSGENGMTILGVGTHTGLNYDYFIPREDTVISVCNGVTPEKTPINLRTARNWNVTLKLTDECLPLIGTIITEITIDSGSIKCF